MTRNSPELGSHEDFVEQAAYSRKEARASMRYALGSAAMSGVFTGISAWAYSEGGGNILLGGLSTVVAVGAALSAREAAGSVFSDIEHAEFYDNLAQSQAKL